MRIDFGKDIDRTQSGSIKWDFTERFLTPAQAAANPLPLWIADTEFPPPPCVTSALKSAIETGVLGYSAATNSYLSSVKSWQKTHFDWDTQSEWILQTPGVVTALNIAIQAFTQPGDSVLIQPPVYSHFREDVLLNEREVVSAPLRLNADGTYRFDRASFEAAIRHDTKLFILCNPHNPTGNVWSEEDLRAMGDICLKHRILVISDEIHQDLIFNPKQKHIPFVKLGSAFANNSIVCTAPSKTFNLAGLQVSNLFIPNEEVRATFSRQMTKNGIHLVNQLGLIACEAAYRDGAEWLEEFLKHIKANHEYLSNELQKHLPQLKVTPTDSLYLAWVDFRALSLSTDALMDFLTIKAKVWFDNGVKFSQEGHGFMRVNVGCSRATLAEAIERLKHAVNAI